MTRLILEFGSNAYPFTQAKLYKMLNASRHAGVWGVKVQLFKAEHFPEAEREEKRQYEFPRRLYPWFVMQAHELGLNAGASVFDDEACDLVASAKSDFLKLATRERWNAGLRYRAQRAYGGTIIRSFDITKTEEKPPDRMRREIPMGCIPEYPVEWTFAKLLYQVRLVSMFYNKAWGWSSHTADIKDCLSAHCGGASVIEKHVDLDGKGPEAAWSIDFKTAKELAEAIK